FIYNYLELTTIILNYHYYPTHSSSYLIYYFFTYEPRKPATFLQESHINKTALYCLEDENFFYSFTDLVVFRYENENAFNTSSPQDRKSTRLNSSHEWISYAVFCLKKKN